MGLHRFEFRAAGDAPDSASCNGSFCMTINLFACSMSRDLRSSARELGLRAASGLGPLSAYDVPILPVAPTAFRILRKLGPGYAGHRCAHPNGPAPFSQTSGIHCVPNLDFQVLRIQIRSLTATRQGVCLRGTQSVLRHPNPIGPTTRSIPASRFSTRIRPIACLTSCNGSSNLVHPDHFYAWPLGRSRSGTVL